MHIKQAITFAQLAYLDFKAPESLNSVHLIGANKNDYSVEKLTTLMYKSYMRDITPNSDNIKAANKDANKFKTTFESTLNTMSDWSIVDVLDDNGSSASNSGFYGVSFFNKRTKELVVSFRGTEPNKDNFKDIGADTSIPTIGLKQLLPTMTSPTGQLIQTMQCS